MYTYFLNNIGTTDFLRCKFGLLSMYVGYSSNFSNFSLLPTTTGFGTIGNGGTSEHTVKNSTKPSDAISAFS